ncbi:restriction endonuclease subunit S [Flavobacterium sp.]
MSNSKLIPELRFPEFKDDGEWIISSVNQVASYENGRAHEQNIVVNGEYVVVNSKFISTNGEVIKYSDSPNCLAVKNDILMVLSDVPNGRAIAKCFYVVKDNYYTVNQRVCRITPKSVDGKILYYLLNRNQYFLKFDDGIKQTNLRNEDVLDCPLPLPNSVVEQQKIASCISSLDELIAGYNDKLNALKEQKKGLLQNLFPQEGEKVPRLRFKEFKGDGEWVEKKLGNKDVSFFVSEKVSITKLNIDSYVSTENMLSEFYGITTASKLPSSGSFTKFRSGDILISNIRPYLKKVWKSNFTGGASNDVIVFRNGSEVISDFLEFLIKNDDFINYVMKSVKGVKMPRGDKNAMQEYTVYIPSKKEQQKIADSLSSLDTLIKELSDKIEQLKFHKKGLLQGLFPNVNI